MLLFTVLATPGQVGGSNGVLPIEMCIGLTGPAGIIGIGIADPVTVTFRMGSFLPFSFSFTNLS